MSIAHWCKVVLLGSLLATGSICAQGSKEASDFRGAPTGSISDGAATYTLNNYGTSDWSSNFVVDGVDHLFSLGYWYRLAGGTDETVFPAPSSASFSGNAATLGWTNFSGTGLDATLDLVITEPAEGSGELTSTLTISNTGSTDQSIDVFSYTDFDLAGSSGGDSAVLASANNAITITDDVTTGTSAATGGDAYQVANWPTIRDLAGNAAVDDLDNSGLPFGPGDFTGAFQWQSRTVPAGGQLTFEDTRGVSIPQPLAVPVGEQWALALLILALLAVAGLIFRLRA
jgi:hypothetical protein